MLLDVVKTGLLWDIRRERRLPFPGEVLVNEGQQVQPDDVIAEASLPGNFYMLNIARGLDVAVEDAKEFLARQLGEDINAGDVIAQFEGRIPRLVRTPFNGRFVAFHQGHALLETDRNQLRAQAGMMGVVESVIPEYGAVLITNGLLIQGVWGNGHIGFGELHVLEDTWKTPLVPKMLDDEIHNQVIVAGQCADVDAFVNLEERDVAGLLLGSLAPGLISAAAALTIPVMLLQGFGSLPTDPAILEWLAPFAGKTVSINAAEVNRLTGERPELIIPQSDGKGTDALKVRTQLRVGQQVRLFSGANAGRVGKVLEVIEKPTPFSSGLPLPAAMIELGNEETIMAPQQNLMVLA